MGLRLSSRARIEVAELPNSIRRRITLLDLLILIAATGRARLCGCLRYCISGLDAHEILSRRPGRQNRELHYKGAETYASTLLSPWSFALLVLSLRPPRPPYRRIARDPGFIACAAATAGVVLYLALCSMQIAFGKLAINPGSIWRIALGFANSASLMVAGSWLSLALGGRWRMEPSWLGWAGGILGIAWLGLYGLGVSACSFRVTGAGSRGVHHADASGCCGPRFNTIEAA